MATWQDLGREIEAWTSAGRAPTLWWRDDDLEFESPALDRLLDLSGQAGVPVALAAVPRDLAEGLGARLAPVPGHAVLQHGFAHANHAPDDARKEEYGDHRPLPEMADEIAGGWRRIARLAGALPVFVPPWNRVSETVVGVLARCGLRGLSALGPRPGRVTGGGLVQVNVHVDIMDWGAYRFAGDEPVLDQVLAHLGARRRGEVDATEPTGVMTHHRVHDDGCWSFLSRLFAATGGGCRWLTAPEAFAA
ncbi:MAG: polysaccharide deacetylase family protein [Hyphomicrobiales bacterium]|nr:polysaccharide deacetylase family protein [Hyphomicrobiales bacterium]MCP5373269.1 polysaccharide deacetylase family protein [Hyphomicrobiales bacterium]